MDALKKLKCELPGVKAVISQYTHEGNIMNFLDGLNSGIRKSDGEEILYFLEEICKWYNGKIHKIISNGYARNKEAHIRNGKLLNELYKELQGYNFNSVVTDDTNTEEKNTPLIFLSHCSKDQKYGDALEKLFTGIGIKPEQLIYSSHPLHKIPLDKNIFEYLRSAFERKLFVIFLWSDDYLESAACLNEMGAAWITQSEYTNIYVPTFDFNNPKYRQCAVDKDKMGAVLNGNSNCKTSIIELKDKLTEMFSLNVDEKTWTYVLDQFMDDIK